MSLPKCCKDTELKLNWVQFQNNSLHVEARCGRCDKFLQYVNQDMIDLDKVGPEIKAIPKGLPLF